VGVVKRRRTWFLGLILSLLVVVFLITRGPEAPVPNPPGTFSFAVLGDAPYYPWEDLQFQLVLKSLNANDLSWIIHVGDIFWRPCTDDHYRKNVDRFNALRHPVIYTPGDNEWVDCWEPESGGFGPLERLDTIRRIYFATSGHSLGAVTLTVASQSSGDHFPEFVENVRWVHEGFVFATVNIVGSENAMKSFPGRTEADDSASKRRTEAAAAWVRESFAEARNINASAVVVSFHASAELEGNPDDAYRQAFEPFITVIEEEAERFARPVLLAHGDGHKYTVDKPLVRRTTGQLLENVTRLQVPGSPAVGWVRVVVTPGATDPFVFDQHVVPRWKYW
jgi:hypothetical protein